MAFWGTDKNNPPNPMTKRTKGGVLLTDQEDLSDVIDESGNISLGCELRVYAYPISRDYLNVFLGTLRSYGFTIKRHDSFSPNSLVEIFISTAQINPYNTKMIEYAHIYLDNDPVTIKPKNKLSNLIPALAS